MEFFTSPRRRIQSFGPRGDQAFSLTYSTPLARKDAARFYQDCLPQRHWEVTLDSRSGGMTSIAARRPNGSRLTVNIIEYPADQRTMIGVFHAPALDAYGD